MFSAIIRAIGIASALAALGLNGHTAPAEDQAAWTAAEEAAWLEAARAELTLTFEESIKSGEKCFVVQPKENKCVSAAVLQGAEHMAAKANKQFALHLERIAVSDADLACVRGLNHLGVLSLSGTETTDAALVHLRELSTLQVLDLSSTKVTDAGLRELTGLSQLRALDIRDTRVTGAGIEQLLHLKHFKQLSFSADQINDQQRKVLEAYFPQYFPIVIGPKEKLFDLRPTASYQTLADPCSIVFSPNGKLLAIGGFDVSGPVELLDVATGKRAVLRERGSPLLRMKHEPIAFSEDGTRIAINAEPRTFGGAGAGGASFAQSHRWINQVQIWDLTCDPVQRLKLIETGMRAEYLNLSHNGSHLAASDFQRFKIYAVATGEALPIEEAPFDLQRQIRASAIPEESHYRKAISGAHLLYLQDRNSEYLMRKLSGIKGVIHDSAVELAYRDEVKWSRFSPDGSRVFAQMERKQLGSFSIMPQGGDRAAEPSFTTLLIADVMAQREKARLRISGHRQFVALSADCVRIVTTNDPLIAVWRVVNGQPRLLGQFDPGPGFNGPLAMTPDGKTLVTCGKKLSLWDLTEFDWR